MYREKMSCARERDEERGEEREDVSYSSTAWREKEGENSMMKNQEEREVREGERERGRGLTCRKRMFSSACSWERKRRRADLKVGHTKMSLKILSLDCDMRGRGREGEKERRGERNKAMSGRNRGTLSLLWVIMD